MLRWARPGTSPRLDVDVVVLGATRRIFDESAWESVSARVMMESRKPVLVVPAAHRDTPDDTTEAPQVLVVNEAFAESAKATEAE